LAGRPACVESRGTNVCSELHCGSALRSAYDTCVALRQVASADADPCSGWIPGTVRSGGVSDFHGSLRSWATSRLRLHRAQSLCSQRTREVGGSTVCCAMCPEIAWERVPRRKVRIPQKRQRWRAEPHVAELARPARPQFLLVCFADRPNALGTARLSSWGHRGPSVHAQAGCCCHKAPNQHRRSPHAHHLPALPVGLVLRAIRKRCLARGRRGSSRTEDHVADRGFTAPSVRSRGPIRQRGWGKARL
jgi:hypothetical protein